MSTLNGALSIATRALLAEQAAMHATTNNLANINTPGYSRQIPVLSAEDPIVSGNVAYGNGVTLEGYRSLRDRILGLRIDEELQNQAGRQSFVAAMNQVQVLFSDASGGIGGALSNFFNSVGALTTQADNESLRQNVLNAAQNVADAFHEVTGNLSSLHANLDLQMQQSVNEINRLTSQIARLNQRIDDFQKIGQEAGALEDQRQQAISDLSQIVDVEETETDEGLTLTTANGVALVVDGQSFALDASIDSATSVRRIHAGAVDVTDNIEKGSLGGILAVQQKEIPQLQAELDSLAAAFSRAVNTVHQTGTDGDGNPGGLLFSAPPPGDQGAAAFISVLLTDPATLAMSATMAAGGNEIANQIFALKDQPLLGSQTAVGAYAQIVFHAGSHIADAQASLDTSTLVLQQLQDQQSALSGVSIDEETANLLQFQRGFEAAAHVISVIDSMMQTVLNMGVTR